MTRDVAMIFVAIVSGVNNFSPSLKWIGSNNFHCDSLRWLAFETILKIRSLDPHWQFLLLIRVWNDKIEMVFDGIVSCENLY